MPWKLLFKVLAILALGWLFIFGSLIGQVVVVLVLLGAPLFVIIGGFALACFLSYPTHPLIFGESWSGTLDNFSFI